jgi:hypothetical protein
MVHYMFSQSITGNGNFHFRFFVSILILIIKTLRLYAKTTGAHTNIRWSRKMALKCFSFWNFEKLGDFYLNRDGRERVSKAVDLVSRLGGSHVYQGIFSWSRPSSFCLSFCHTLHLSQVLSSFQRNYSRYLCQLFTQLLWTHRRCECDILEMFGHF